MEYRNLGRTGLKVSRLCLGTNMMGSYVSQEACTRVVDACLEHGVNFIDTSDVYNAGRSEELIGVALKGRRQEFIVATKVALIMGPGGNAVDASRRHILEGVEASLRRLDTGYIDLYQIHRWDAETPLEETLRTLNDLVRQGKVRYIGCSNYAAWQLCKSLWVSDKLGLERFESLQPPYNLGNRAIERELLPLCADQKIGVIAYQVLMGGLLSGAYDRTQAPPEGSHLGSPFGRNARERYWKPENFDLTDRVKALARQVGSTSPQLALAWALANPLITSVIVGASKPEQVAQNAKAVDITLTPPTLEALNKL